MVRFNVLGSVTVTVDDTTVDLGTPKERQLLAVLLVDANTIVSQDRVIDALWPDRPPAKPLSSLRAYLSHLRKALSSADLSRDTIVNDGDGYRLQIDATTIDALQFEQLLEQARPQSRPLKGRIEAVDKALSLVRGDPYADMPYAEFAQREIDRLDELVASAHELRAELALEAGQASVWIPELTALVRRYPYRDGLRAAQMRALALTGRHGEALQAYSEHRNRLIEDMGVQPGGSLQSLERELLALDAEASPADHLEPARPTHDVNKGQSWRMVTTLAVRATGDQESELAAVIGQHTGRPPTRAGRFLRCHFGLPVAHGRDPEHAVRAASRIANEPSLTTGVGLATGMALVDFDNDGVAASDAVEVAETLAERAEAGEVLVDDLTRDLTSRLASFVSAEDGVHIVLEVGDHVDPMSPLLGRDEELGLLNRRLEVAADGEGQVVAVGGDPGVGKTRLVDELILRAADIDATIVRLDCSPFHEQSALHPLLQHLETRPKRGNEELRDPPPALRAARRLLQRWVTVGDGALTSISADPDERRRALLRAAELEIATATGSGPVVCVVEDVQWVDGSTDELIRSLAAAAVDRRFLLVMTHRTPTTHELVDDAGITAIKLGPLPRAVTTEIARTTTGAGELPATVLEEIAARSNGIPLYAEEITREVVERGRLDGSVPATLRDSLTARLDRISWARDIVQAAAVIGDDFDAALLCSATAREATEALSDLHRLCDHGILVRRGSTTGLRYSFRHSLVRDIAYESVPPTGRADLHHRVAAALEASAAGRVDHGRLAHHWSAAGDVPMAVREWLTAARDSLALSAASDAITQAERGLAEVEHAPGAALESEVSELHVVLGAAYTQRNGPASPEAVANFTAVLTRGVASDPAQRFRALWGQCFAGLTGKAPAEVLPLAEELLVQAGEFDDDEMRIQAHHAMWSTLLISGRFEDALAHTDSARDLYVSGDHHHLTYEYGGHDPGACMWSTRGLARWMLGETKEGSEDAQQAILLADRLDHGYSQLEASFGALTIAALDGAVDQLRAMTEGLDRLVQSGSVPAIARGYVDGYLAVADLAAEDEVVPALEQLRASSADWRDLWGCYCFPLDAALAQALVSADDAKAGLEEINAILDGQPDRARWLDVELHRVRANAHSALGSADTVIAHELRTATELAQTQRAVTLELRMLSDLMELRPEVVEGDQRERLAQLSRALSPAASPASD
ncbi:MAG: BTAD domain-containing putative transcriptional regulator [Acidimicrobiales bacterium]